MAPQPGLHGEILQANTVPQHASLADAGQRMVSEAIAAAREAVNTQDPILEECLVAGTTNSPMEPPIRMGDVSVTAWKLLDVGVLALWLAPVQNE